MTWGDSPAWGDVGAGIVSLFGAVKKAFPQVKTMTAGWGWRTTGAIPPVDVPLDVYVCLFYTYCFDDVNTVAENCTVWKKDLERWRESHEFWFYWASEPGDNSVSSAHKVSGQGGFGDGTWLQTFLQWPVIASRLLLWLGAAEQVDGWLFWAIDNWDLVHGRPIVKRINQSLLTNAANFTGSGSLGNTGDGVLLYGDELGPVPGLRYVNLADGIEDAELFRLCGDGCADLISKLVTSGDQWRDDPALLEETRRRAAARVVDAS